MSGPDRIWAFYSDIFGAMWTSYIDDGATEYIRHDPAVLAALPDVQAIVAAAVKAEREACAKEAEDHGEPGMYQSASDAFRAGYADAGQHIAAAIRKRGEGKV